MTEEMLALLRSRLKLDDEDVFELQGPLGTADLMGLPAQRPDLGFPVFAPRVPDLGGEDDEGVFHTLQQGDVLVHHPYESFTNVVAFVEAAASDPGARHQANPLPHRRRPRRSGRWDRRRTASRWWR